MQQTLLLSVVEKSNSEKQMSVANVQRGGVSFQKTWLREENIFAEARRAIRGDANLQNVIRYNLLPLYSLKLRT